MLSSVLGLMFWGKSIYRGMHGWPSLLRGCSGSAESACGGSQGSGLTGEGTDRHDVSMSSGCHEPVAVCVSYYTISRFGTGALLRGFSIEVGKDDFLFPFASSGLSVHAMRASGFESAE